MAKTAGFLISAGILLAAVFTMFSGFDYRRQESAGFEPGPAPQWILMGTSIGLVLMALGFCALIIGLGLMMVRDTPPTRGGVSRPG